MPKILSLDPSGNGTTGICLTNGKAISFREFKASNWKEHYSAISQMVKDFKPTTILYENTNYIYPRQHQGTVNLLKLIGSLEGLKHTFTFIKQIDSILVKQVKDFKGKLLKGKAKITELEYQPGKGWIFKGQKLSLHELDAWLVYQLWKEKHA